MKDVVKLLSKKIMDKRKLQFYLVPQAHHLINTIILRKEEKNLRNMKIMPKDFLIKKDLVIIGET